MKIVNSGIQVFYTGLGEPLAVYPRFCINEGMINSPNAPCLSKGLTLLEQMKRKPNSTIVFWRTFALGDILMLTPVFNWLKEEYPACNLYLATTSGFMGLFRYWDLIHTIETRRIFGIDYDIGYYLDGIVEQDHSETPENQKHRLDIYCEFLGIPMIKDPTFSLPYGEDEKKWANAVVSAFKDEGKPVVAMQVYGSTEIKRLPLGKVMRIALELNKICSIVMVHNFREGPGPGGVLDLSGQTSVHQLAALIDAVDAVITMDSGVLWVAHCTSTPVIALLGPTREQERLTYHRNYAVVNLSKMIGCQPCFERRTTCKGKIQCMKESPEDQIVDEIRTAIVKLCGS